MVISKLTINFATARMSASVPLSAAVSGTSAYRSGQRNIQKYRHRQHCTCLNHFHVLHLLNHSFPKITSKAENIYREEERGGQIRVRLATRVNQSISPGNNQLSFRLRKLTAFWLRICTLRGEMDKLDRISPNSVERKAVVFDDACEKVTIFSRWGKNGRKKSQHSKRPKEKNYDMFSPRKKKLEM